MICPWSERRSKLSHDRLANRFLPALQKWLRVLDGAVIDERFATSFPEKTLSEWNALRDDVLELTRRYGDEMSPRTLLSSPPLADYIGAHHAWLGETIHVLWLARCDVSQQTEMVRQMVQAADSACEKLRLELERSNDRSSPSLRNASAEFVDCCLRLRRAMSAFDDKIRVV